MLLNTHAYLHRYTAHSHANSQTKDIGHKQILLGGECRSQVECKRLLWGRIDRTRGASPQAWSVLEIRQRSMNRWIKIFCLQKSSWNLQKKVLSRLVLSQIVITITQGLERRKKESKSSGLTCRDSDLKDLH